MKMIIEIQNIKLEVELYDNQSAKELAAALPQTISMSRWGDEYYGKLSASLSAGGKKRDNYEVGEVAYWPPGNAFCIFFGPTPASFDDQPMMASPGIPLGMITSDVAVLKKLGASLSGVKLTASE